MKNLCLQLLYANSEEEIRNIIESDPEMRNPNNWYPLDDRDTNHNITGNQASNGGKAATELVTNMVDAILTKRCLEEGIDPKSPEAPDTMYKAVKKFLSKDFPNLQGGKITQVDDDKLLKRYAERNLIIGLTGKSNSKPCFVFCDNGEGQYPENFPKTFLSLSVKNKSEIPFVQGKYNMGSSGVLDYCGHEWSKLILSRRYDGKKPWGWTLIRKNASKSGEYFAEYFAPGDKNNIQTINDASICPLVTKAGDKVENFSLETGSIIKLYDYYAGKNISSFRETREVFNENLVETILPFRIYDCRAKPEPANKDYLRKLGVDDRPFYGLEYLILKTYKEEYGLENLDIDPERRILEDVGAKEHPVLGTISISAVVLKEKTGTVGWFKNSNSRIFHHVNGQVHAKQQRRDLSEWKLGALMDRVVIFVDASDLKDGPRRDIWKPDRERVKDTQTGMVYQETVRKLIEESSVLGELNYRIAKEKMEHIIKDSPKEILKDLLKRDKNFAALLAGDALDVAVYRGPRQKPQKIDRDDLQYDPSYIKFEKSPSPFELAINKSRLIKCVTNAQDGFFTRDQNKGEVIFDNDEVRKKFIFTRYLKNGTLFLSLQPLEENVQLGDTIKFRIGLKTMQMDIYTDEEVEITFAKQDERKKEKTPQPPRPPQSKMAGLPGYSLATKDGRSIDDSGDTTVKWEDVIPGFDDKDGGHVAELGEETERSYYINYDNVYFQNSLKFTKTDAEKTRIRAKFILGMRIFLLSMERSLNASKQDMDKKFEGNSAEVREFVRRQAAAGAASVALTLSEQLPIIFNQPE